MLKISRNKLCEYNKSCSSLHILVKIPFCTGDPTKIRNVTTMPLVCNKHPRKTGGLAIGALGMGGGGAGRILVSRSRSLPGRRWGTTTCSHRAQGRLGFERGQLRRGRAATAGGGACDGLRLRWGKCNAEQWMAAQVSMAPMDYDRKVRRAGEGRGGEFTGGRQWRARWSGSDGARRAWRSVFIGEAPSVTSW
jgi:hypothetical protein